MKHAYIKQTWFLLAAMLLLSTLLLTGCGSKVDASEYVSLTFSGSNGRGEANLEVNKPALIEAVIGQEPDSSYEAFSKWLNEYLIYDEGISVSCSPETGLSNGDTVTVTITLSDTAAKSIRGGKTEVKVEGLPELQVADLFEGIAVTYEGIGDLARVKLERTSSDPAVQDCLFQVEPEFGIHNGDTVTITITNAELLEQTHLCTPAQLSRTYTVAGLDEYLTDPDLLPQTHLRQIIDRFVSESQKQNDSWFSYSEARYYKTYFLTEDPASTYLADSVNALEIFVSYDEYMDGEYRRTIYTPLVFRDLILHPDGSISGLDYESGSNAVFYTSPEEILNRRWNAYVIEEVYVEY